MMRTWFGLLLVLSALTAVSADPTWRIIQAVEQFKETFLKEPYTDYILTVNFTTLAAQKIYHNDIVLTHNEKWTSWCLDVTIGVNLPESIREKLPSTFWEFRVFYNLRQNPTTPSGQASSSEGEMCPTLALICPDGSVASVIADCKRVCGAPPIGGLSASEVDSVRDSFWEDYGSDLSVTIDTLYGKSVRLTPVERYSDFCLDVALPTYLSSANYPDVYNGVRMFYYSFTCSAIVCPDGSIVGCNSECPVSSHSVGSTVFAPLAAIVFVVTLSSCCCYLRGRRCRANKCNYANATTTPTQGKQESIYPSEQYVLLQNQEPEVTEAPQVAMPMMPHPMLYPPMMPMMTMVSPQGMPPMPPPMMMMPNGSYPVMMQAPNGMWYPAPPHPNEM